MSGHHIVPFKINIKTFSVLIVLTVITVYTAMFVDLGSMNLPLAMVIATVKATVVALWFMHLKYDSWANRLIIVGAVMFVALLFGFSAFDYFTRI